MSTDVATYIGPLIKVKLNNEIVVVEKKCCINEDCNQFNKEIIDNSIFCKNCGNKIDIHKENLESKQYIDNSELYFSEEIESLFYAPYNSEESFSYFLPNFNMPENIKYKMAYKYDELMLDFDFDIKEQIEELKKLPQTIKFIEFLENNFNVSYEFKYMVYRYFC